MLKQLLNAAVVLKFVGIMESRIAIHVLSVPSQGREEQSSDNGDLPLQNSDMKQRLSIGQHFSIKVSMHLVDLLQDELFLVVAQDHLTQLSSLLLSRHFGTLALRNPVLSVPFYLLFQLL